MSLDPIVGPKESSHNPTSEVDLVWPPWMITLFMTATLKQITSHFKHADSILYRQFRSSPSLKPLSPAQPSQYFSHLTREIIGQQLSGAVAQVIFTRFKSLFPRRRITPAYLLTIADPDLRAIGLSGAKAQYVKNLARYVTQQPRRFAHLSQESDQAVAKYLTVVKGIGPWTAEMFLMFTLGREDIFSPHDLGLKKAIISLYHTGPEISAEQLEQISLPWSPYRTYASLILWDHVDS